MTRVLRNAAIVAIVSLALRGLTLPDAVAATGPTTTLSFASDTSVQVVELGQSAVATWVHPVWPTLAGATAIWGYASLDDRSKFGPFTFRKTFELPPNAVGIVGSVQVTADNAYELWVNGTFVGSDGVLSQVIPCDTHLASWQTFETYDLGAYLKPGSNVVDVREVNYFATSSMAGLCEGTVLGVHPENNPAMLLFGATVTYGVDVTPPVFGAIDPVEATTDAAACTRSGLALAPPAVTDDYGPVTLTNDAPAVFPLGTTNVTWTAKDAAGNTATASQAVTVRDVERPRVTAPAGVTVGTGPGSTSPSAVVSDARLGTASALDNCAVSSVARSGVPAGNVFPLGSTTVTYTATDGSGNAASATQLVTVVDDTPPVLQVPKGVTVEATSPTGTLVIYSVSATDNVGVTAQSCAPASGSTFPIGTTTVTCTASDAAGNSASASFAVTVGGATAQVLGLRQLILDLGLQKGQERSLLAKLEAVMESLERGRANAAANQLRALVHEVYGRYLKAEDKPSTRVKRQEHHGKTERCETAHDPGKSKDGTSGSDKSGSGSDKGKSARALDDKSKDDKSKDDKSNSGKSKHGDQPGTPAGEENRGKGKDGKPCAGTDAPATDAPTTAGGDAPRRENELTLTDAQDILLAAYQLLQVIGSK